MPVELRVCPWCSGEKFKTALEILAPDYDEYSKLINVSFNAPIRYLTCLTCDLTFRNRVYNQSESKNLYAGAYRNHILNKTTADCYLKKILAIPPEHSELEAKVGNLKNLLKTTKISSAIDVGCGIGVFLYKLQSAFPGIVVEGIEPHREFASVASRLTSAKIHVQEFEKFSLHFHDLVTFIHVLEHVVSPWRLLKDAGSTMRKGAYLYVETPSIRDVEVLPPEHDRFMSPHNYLFSIQSITSMLRDSGFNPLSVCYAKTKRGKFDLRGFAIKS